MGIFTAEISRTPGARVVCIRLEGDNYAHDKIAKEHLKVDGVYILKAYIAGMFYNSIELEEFEEVVFATYYFDNYHIVA